MMKTKDCFIGLQAVSMSRKWDDAVWRSRCHGKLRASLISAALSVKTRRHVRSSPPQHFGGRKKWAPLLARDDSPISTGSVGAAVWSVWSVRLRQATGTLWPKSQMAFRSRWCFAVAEAQGAVSSNAVFIVVKSRGRQQQSNTYYYTIMGRYFNAALNVVCVLFFMLRSEFPFLL